VERGRRSRAGGGNGEISGEDEEARAGDWRGREWWGDWLISLSFFFSCAKSVRRGGCWLPAVLGRRMVGNSEGRRRGGRAGLGEREYIGISFAYNTFKMEVFNS
jgi:hypothetical protein